MPPTFAVAVGQGLLAVTRELWLVPAGALVAAMRRAAAWPALAVLGAVVVRAALAAAAAHPGDPTAPAGGVLVALESPRVGALVLGLALAGALLAGALRVAWLSGALPTLGPALAGAPRSPRFAAGIAYGLPSVLAAAALGLAAEAGAALFGLTLVLAVLRVAARVFVAPLPAPALVAAAGALALTLAAAAPLAAGALTDAAVARAALLGEGPSRAFAGALRRFLARPGAFLLSAGVFAAAGALGPLSIEGLGGAVLGFARGVGPLLLFGPDLMVGALALGVAAAVDLWWLGAVASLACGGGGSPGDAVAPGPLAPREPTI